MSYSDEQKEQAFRVWCLQANRNAALTARMLKEQESGFDVTRQTVHNWSVDDNWAIRADRDLFAASPRLRFQTQAELILAAPESAEFLRKLVRLDPSLGREVPMVVNGEILLDADGNPRMMMIFDEKMLKLRKEAAQLCLDRTGFSPIGSREVGNLEPPPDTTGIEASEIRKIADPERLAELEAQFKRDVMGNPLQKR